MFERFRRWRRGRDLQRARAREVIEERDWRATLARYAFLADLDATERARLKDLVHLFLERKQFATAHDLPLTQAMRLSVAAQACVLVLYLGIEYFDGWSGIILYPTQFLPRHTYVDPLGVTHESAMPHAGEAWLGGPVILSWDDVEQGAGDDGANVVIHEFAHKLDMLNGTANGFPPLHGDMRREVWAQVFTREYEAFSREVDAGRYTPVDPYAAEAPAEFFAVMSEVFFERPDLVRNHHPAIYEQLALFYRQDPFLRMERGNA